MTFWFESLPVIEKVFFFISTPATFILLIQTVMLFFGGDEAEPGDVGLDSDTTGIGGSTGSGVELDADLDLDFETDIVLDADLDIGAEDGPNSEHGNTDSYGLRFLTMRGIIAFLTIAGWTGVLGIELGLPSPIACLIAAICGFGAMVGIAFLVQSLMRLQVSGNLNYRMALGSLADVYLTIPANGSGTGKITLTLQGVHTELYAITEHDSSIRTGALVRVTDVVRDNVLVVEPLHSADSRENAAPRRN